ncbi:MAG: hypothetical protein JSV91_01100 [Phycisphaerales bacterium]|nr:MAG: hypothetical protein JSV91_01100 [Phycisphaerales bacterium]
MKRKKARLGKWSVLVGVGLAVLLLSLTATTTVAFERYDEGCDNGDCHGGFWTGVSPKGTVFPSDNKHEMHKGPNDMNSDCNLCHGGEGEMVLNSSGGTDNNPGVGCVGCHGRDYGGGIGNSGVGLRAHHVNSGVTICAGCHSNDPDPLPENVSPTYYGTPDTNCDDPCNVGPAHLENYSIGDTLGLDNDGDLLYDTDDPDCADCPADVNFDTEVNIDDLFQVLGAWGPCDACPEDINEDGIVNIDDIFAVLGDWGPCF